MTMNCACLYYYCVQWIFSKTISSLTETLETSLTTREQGKTIH